MGDLFFAAAAAAFLFGLDSLCLFRRKPFLVSISGRPLLLFSLGEAKNGFIFEITFWLRVWSQSVSFLEFVASNSRLACLGSDRMRAERVVAALLWFYKDDSGS